MKFLQILGFATCAVALVTPHVSLRQNGALAERAEVPVPDTFVDESSGSATEESPADEVHQ
jgi:hypothetical protein